ncbi:aminotransferase class IV [Nitratifractor sp.]
MKLFETIRCEGGEAKHLEYHHRRIQRSVGRDFPLEDLIEAPTQGLWRCKLIYDEASIHSIEYFPYRKRTIRSFRLLEGRLCYERKYLDRSALDALFEQRGEADEILIVREGFLSDTSIANLALLIDGEWLTPERPLLTGTTRERLLECGKLRPAPLKPDALLKAEKLALLNAMIGFDILPEFTVLS